MGMDKKINRKRIQNKSSLNATKTIIKKVLSGFDTTSETKRSAESAIGKMIRKGLISASRGQKIISRVAKYEL